MPRPFPEDHEEPWTEEEWLEEMKQNDARADRFGELLETLMDHPNRDEIVAREMGWDKMADDLEAAREQGIDLSGSEAEDEIAMDDDDDDDEDEDDTEDGEDVAAWSSEDEDLEDLEDEREPDDVRIDPARLLGSNDADAEEDEEDDEEEERLFGREPARDIAEYKLAHRLTMKMMRVLEPYGKGEEDPTDGLLSEAYAGPMIASAKIVGGHSLGYEKHSINGNIARQRVGLDAMDKSIRAFEQLAKDGFLPKEIVESLLPELRQLRTALVNRIERMRARARRLHGKE